MAKTDRRMRRRELCRLLLAGALAASGCGYSLRPPYDQNIRTVHVAMARSVVFRRDLNQPLTEKIIKELEQRSGYKVVGDPADADYILDVEITFNEKNAVLQNPNNLPRQVMSTINVSAAFYPNKDGAEPTRGEKRATFSATANDFGELGETITVANDKALDKLAREIVGNLEQVW